MSAADLVGAGAEWFWWLELCPALAAILTILVANMGGW
jgi:hypothetical protein